MEKFLIFQKKKNSQIGFEFILLTTFLFVALAVVIGVVGFFVSGFNEDRLDREREEFVQTIIREFENALASPNNYRRGFIISDADLKLFNISFIESTSAIIVEDYRKHGFDSQITYYYELGDVFIFGETFFSSTIEDPSDIDFGNIRITFDLEKLTDSDKITLSSASSNTMFNQILLYTSLTPGNNFPLSLGDSFEIGLTSNINRPHYSFIDYDDSLIGWWRFEEVNPIISGLGTSESDAGFSCRQILQNNPSSASGVYWIQVEESTPFQVYCDMVTDGGGWTLISVATGGSGELIVAANYATSIDIGINEKGKMPRSAKNHNPEILVRDLEFDNWLIYNNWSYYSSESALNFFTLERTLSTSSDCKIHTVSGDCSGSTCNLHDNVCSTSILDPNLRIKKTSGYIYNYNEPLRNWWRHGGWWVGANPGGGNNDGRVHATSYGSSHDLKSRTDKDLPGILLSDGAQGIFWRESYGLIRDESGNNNHGFSYGAIPTEDGAFGRGVEFTGGDRIEVVPSPEILNLNKDFTVSLWVNTTMNSPDNQYFIDRWDITNNQRVWGILLRGGGNHASVLTSHIGSDAIYLDDSTPINNGEWNHLVMVHNGSTLLLYVNGVLQAQDSTIELHDSNTPLQFGRSSNIQTQLDDIIIFNRTLSSDEVQALYSSTALTYSNQFLKASLGDVSFQGFAVDLDGNKITAQRRVLNFLNPLFYIQPTPFNNAILRLGESDISIHLNDSITNEYYSFVNLDNSLVGWWRFDEFAPIRGVRFSGEEEIVYHQFYNNYFSNSVLRGFEPSNSNRFNGNASYSVWIRPEGNFNGAYIFTDRNFNEGQIRLFTGPSSRIEARWASGNQIDYPITFNFGEWYHLGMTHERNDADGLYHFRLYVNGQQVGSDSTSISGSNSNYGPDNALRIGSGFRGVMSEIQIYEEVLSEDDFKQLYTGQVFTNRDLVLYLDFKEDDAIIDKSLNSFEHSQGDDFIQILEGPSPSLNALQITKDYQVAHTNVYGNSNLLGGSSPSSGGQFNGDTTYSMWFRSLGDFNGGYLFTDNNINEGQIQIFEDRIRARWASGNVISYDINIEEGEWYHVAMTHERSDVDDRYYFTLYLNGVEVGTDSRLISTSSSSYGPEGVLRIGPEFEGSMSNIQIHNRVLTTTEIQNMFNNYAIITNGIVILYDFQGDTLEEQLQDKSGNDRHIPASNFELGSFDFEFSFLDESGFDNHVRSFRASRNQSGRFGSAIEFDGSSYAIITSEMLSEVHNSGTVTYSLWFNSSSSANQELLFRGSAASSPIIGEIGCIYEPLIRTTDVRLSGCDNSGGISIFSSPINQWNHLAISIDESNDNVLIYLNGNEIDSRNISEVRGDSTRSYAVLNQDSSIINFLILGGWFGNDIISPSFEGLIDELLIFNRSLSSTELLSLYSSSLYKYQNDFRNLPIGSEQYQGLGVNEDAVVVSTEIRTLNFLEPLFYIPPTPSNGSMLSLSDNNRQISLNDNIANNYYSFVNFDNSLVGWWRFEEFGEKRGIFLRRNEDLYFEQFYNNWFSNSVFSGISPSSSNHFNGNASYSAWIQPRGNFGGGRIFTDNNNEGYIQINENSIVAKWDFRTDVSQIVYSININREEWYHVGMSHEKNDADGRYYFRLYVNGELVGTSEEEISPYGDYGPDNALRIGTDFEGIISDVRIFERTLTDDDFQRLYSFEELYEDDLVLYLDFEESYGVFDKSGDNRNSATSISLEFPFKQGPTPFSDAIFVDKSTQFNLRDVYGSGNIFEGISPSDPSDYNGNISLSIWFQPQGDFEGGYLFTDQNLNEASIQVFNDRIRIRWDNPNSIDYLTTIEEDEWYHIVVTHEMDVSEDEYKINLYLNGVLVDSSSRLISTSPSFYGPERNLRIGADFEGWISEIQVYDRILSANQVENIFEASLEDLDGEVTYEGLVIYYDFRGSNIRNRLRDKSGNNFHLPGIQFNIDDFISNRVTRDESGNDNHGRILGATPTEEGKFGGAMEFERSNRDEIVVDINPQEFLEHSSFTMSAWVYVDGSSTSHPPIFVNTDSQGGNTHYNGFKFIDSGTTARFVLEREGFGSFGERQIGFELVPQTWNHVVGVYDREDNIMRLFVNGEFIDSVFAETSIKIFDSLKIGGHSQDNQFFNGKIDEVLIFNRALSSSEVSSLFNSSSNKYSKQFTNILLRPTLYQGFGVNIDGIKVNTPKRVLDFPENQELRQISSLRSNLILDGANNLEIVDDVAYIVSQNSNSITLLNISNSQSIGLIDVFFSSTFFDGIRDIKFKDGLAYITSRSLNPILILNFSDDLSGVSIVGGLTASIPADFIHQIETDENYIYVTSIDTSVGGVSPTFTIVDKSDISDLQPVTFINLNDSYTYQEMVKFDDFILQVIGNDLGGGVKIINVSDPSNPFVVQTIFNPLLRNAYGIELRDSVAFVSSNNKLASFNVNNLPSISLMNLLHLGGFGHRGMSHRDNFLAVTSFSDSKLKIVDVENPFNMRLIMEIQDEEILGGISGVDFSQNCLFAVSRESSSLSSYAFLDIDC